MEGDMVRLGGWLRIAIVLSVLWVLGCPIYMIKVEDERVDALRSLCVRTASDLHLDVQSTHARCDHYETMMFTDPRIWTGTFVSLAFLWIIGGIIFGTVRWIARGFAANRA